MIVISGKSQAGIEHPLTALYVFLSLLIPCKFSALRAGIAVSLPNWNNRNLSTSRPVCFQSGPRIQFAGNFLETSSRWTAPRTIQSNGGLDLQILSLRDVEDLLAERGIDVSYKTVRCWANKFGPAIAANIRNARSRADGLVRLSFTSRT